MVSKPCPDCIGVAALAVWLQDKGLAEEHHGYGHATGTRVAEELLEAFHIQERANG